MIDSNQPRSKNPNYITAVIFDLGSTLFYFDGNWSDVIHQGMVALTGHLQKAGFSLDGEQFISDFKNRLEAYYTQREQDLFEYTTSSILRSLLSEYGYPEASELIIRQALVSLYAVSQNHWLPENDAIPTLRSLHQQGYILGMISNAGDDADVQTLVDKAGLRPFFDQILTSAAIGIRKPHPSIFRTVLDHWDLPASQAVMVGDTLSADILGAHNAGMRGIWIDRRADEATNQPYQGKIQPDAIIHELSELPEVLRILSHTSQVGQGI